MTKSELTSLLVVVPLAAVAACTSPSATGGDVGAKIGAPTSASPTAVAKVDRAALVARLRAIRSENPGAPLARAKLQRQASAPTTDDGGSTPQPAPQPPAFCRQSNGEVPARYKSLVATLNAELPDNTPGAAIAILEHGKLAFAYGAGTKGVNSNAPICPSTLFRIDSMTKAMTAAAYLRTVDDGEARLDQKLIDIAPDVTLPAGADFNALTMRQLLSQQTGISEYTQVGPVTGPSNEGYISKFLTSPEFGADVAFMYPPGALWFYSNTNFMLSGLAIERTSGLTYREAVRRDVTEPLEMRRTSFLPGPVMTDGDYTNGEAPGEPNPDGTPGDLTPVTSAVNAAIDPAGGAFSSVLDFAKFMEFIAQGDESVLSRARWSAMRSAQVGTAQEGSIDSYGYGLYAGSGLGILGPGPYFPEPYIGHGGGSAGWSSDWFIFPRTGFGFLALTNSGYGFLTNTMTQAIEELAGIQPAPFPTVDDVTPAEFPSYVGDYLDSTEGLGRVNVTDVNGTITISMPDLDAAGVPYEPALQALDRASFALTIEGQGVLVTFLRGADGRFDWLRADHVAVAARVDDSDAGAPIDAGSGQ